MIPPYRQGIPLLLKFALVLWACSALCYSSLHTYININEHTEIIIIVIISCILLACFLCVVYIRNQSNKLAFYGIALIAGIFLSLFATWNLEIKMQEILSVYEQNCIFYVEEDQKEGTSCNSATATFIDNCNNKYKVKMQFDSKFDEVHAGDIIKSSAKFSEPYESQISNYWQNGICANARINNPEKLERNDILGLIFLFRNQLIDTIRKYDLENNTNYSQAEGLLNAIVCGQRIDLNNSDLYNSFKYSGLAHLVAVSGAHLSLVTAILLIILKKLKMKKWMIIFFQSIFILAYLICAAIPISALRAAFMAYIAIFSFFGKKRAAPLNSLGICIIILISINPETSVSVSFALSAGSTIGIILFSSLFEYWIEKVWKKCPGIVKSPLALTFSASVCSQPLSIAIFSQFPVIAPLSNIICTPLFSLLCAGGLISSVFASIFEEIFPFISTALMFFAYKISSLMSWIVDTLSSIPYSSIPASMNIFFAIFLTFAICFLLYKFWPKENKKINNKKKINVIALATLATLIIIFIIIPKSGATQLKALDVGQGDSILLQSKGKNFMIDTGNQDNLLKSRLAENNLIHLDGLIITHPDDDHMGSIDVLEQLVVVEKVYVAADLTTCDDEKCKKLMSEIKKLVNESSIEKLNVGDKINFGEIELNVIWPDKYKDKGGNSDSLTVVANIDINNDDDIDARALLCGDAEKDEIDNLLKKQRIPKIDIYKCGHHGSKNALSENSAKTIKPKITLISVGAKNRYGHPAKTTLDMLEKTGSLIYRTDMLGTITCEFNSTGINIKTAK